MRRAVASIFLSIIEMMLARSAWQVVSTEKLVR
jgi:hypothetical protein